MGIRMDFKSIYYPESRFGGFTDIDGTIAFYFRVKSLVTPSSVVLDIGCGTRQSEDPIAMRRDLRVFKGKCRRVIGIDVDENARKNPFLDEFCLVRKNDNWPI